MVPPHVKIVKRVPITEYVNFLYNYELTSFDHDNISYPNPALLAQQMMASKTSP
jgi:hypothetical protein